MRLRDSPGRRCLELAMSESIGAMKFDILAIKGLSVLDRHT